MLVSVFMKILDLSLKASVVIMAVCLIRLLMRKVPKKYVFLLWAAVWFRLLCPLEFHLPVYTVPYMEPLGESFAVQEVTVAETGNVTEDEILPAAADQESQTVTEENKPAMSYKDIAVHVSAYIWLAGIAAFVIYAAVSLYRLKKRLTGAVRTDAHVLISDYIDSPFVIGIVSPDIYLPSSLGEKESEYILLHENCHIERRDPIWKTIAFAALVLHWFNPLVWLSFVLFQKDMEMSCDEAVIEKAGSDIRADYSETLLTFSSQRKQLSIPLAFDEGNPKGRIRHLSQWKKPSKAVAIVLAALCIVMSVLFLSTGNRNYDTCTVKNLSSVTVFDQTSEFQFNLNKNVTRVTLQAEQWHKGNRTVYELINLPKGMQNVLVNWITDTSNAGSDGMVRISVSGGVGPKAAEIPLIFKDGNASWYMNDYPVNYKVSLEPGKSAVLEIFQVQSMMTGKNLKLSSLKEKDITEAEDLIVLRAVCHGGDNIETIDITGLDAEYVTSAVVYHRPDFHSAYDAKEFYKELTKLLESGEGLRKMSDSVSVPGEWMKNEYFEIVLNNDVAVFAGTDEQTMIVSQTGTYTTDPSVLNWLYEFCEGPKLIDRLCGKYTIHPDNETDLIFEISKDGEELGMHSEYLKNGQVIAELDYDISLFNQMRELYEYDRPYADAVIRSSGSTDFWKLTDNTYRLEPDENSLRLIVLDRNHEPVMDSGISLERE